MKEVTIRMSDKDFAKLESELNLKQFMGQINIKHSIAEKLAVMFLLSAKKGVEKIQVREFKEV